MKHNTQIVGMLPGASAPANNPVRDSLHATSDTAPLQTQLPQRKNIRAEFHDYSGGDYFITICTKDKYHYFGKIHDGKMKFSEIGKYAHDALETLHTHYPYAETLLFVVMPNHIHAIIRITEPADAPGSIPTIRTALGVIVGGYKQSVTRFARRNNIEFNWQSRYHDHIIRGTTDGNNIADYILNNVARWDSDCFYNGE